jgi:hypothetical protein
MFAYFLDYEPCIANKRAVSLLFFGTTDAGSPYFNVAYDLLRERQPH